MNWEEIKEKYPEAFEKVLAFWDCDYKSGVGYMSTNDNGTVWIKAGNEMEGSALKYLRTLYDFFDENGIYISVNYTSHELYGWDIINKTEPQLIRENEFDLDSRKK